MGVKVGERTQVWRKERGTGVEAECPGNVGKLLTDFMEEAERKPSRERMERLCSWEILSDAVLQRI